MECICGTGRYLLVIQARDRSTGVALQIWSMAVTIAIAVASYGLVERPIRQGRFVRLPPRTQWVAYACVATSVGLLALLPARTQASADAVSEWPPQNSVPTRLGVSGDSTMLELTMKFPRDLFPGTQVSGVTKIGCGFMTLPYWRAGVTEDPADCERWPAEWRSFGVDFAPEVAVVGSLVWVCVRIGRRTQGRLDPARPSMTLPTHQRSKRQFGSLAVPAPFRLMSLVFPAWRRRKMPVCSTIPAGEVGSTQSPKQLQTTLKMLVTSTWRG